jgi:hypothetical protein
MCVCVCVSLINDFEIRLNDNISNWIVYPEINYSFIRFIMKLIICF